MKLDLNITFDDLSEECKAKIKKLQKLVGKDNFSINYPDINTLVTPNPNWDKTVTYPAISKLPHITSTNVLNDDIITKKDSDITLRKQYSCTACARV